MTSDELKLKAEHMISMEDRRLCGERFTYVPDEIWETAFELAKAYLEAWPERSEWEKIRKIWDDMQKRQSESQWHPEPLSLFIG